MLTKLFPFQERAVDFHLKHHYSLNLLEMGMGKTLIALSLAEEVGGEVLILCPAFLQSNWKREIVKHLGSVKGFTVIPYSSFSKDKLPKISPKVVIADEVHYLKNPKAKRTKAAIKYIEDRAPEYFLGLTGTPIKNRVQEFYTLLSLVSINPNKTSGVNLNFYFHSFYGFSERYCLTKPNPYSGGKDYFGFREDRKEEFKSLLKDKVFKIPSSEGLNLPPLFHKKVFMPVKVPSELEKDFEDNQGGKGSVAKRLAAISKVFSTYEYALNILEQEVTPLVVFTDHVEPAKMLAASFGVKAITGSTALPDRVKIYDKFMRSGGVLVATIGAFSTGVNITNANNLIFNDVSWVPGDNFQAMKRIHRIGQTKACTIHYILGSAIEESIFDKLSEKIKVIDVTNELAMEGI